MQQVHSIYAAYYTTHLFSLTSRQALYWCLRTTPQLTWLVWVRLCQGTSQVGTGHSERPKSMLKDHVKIGVNV